MLRGFLRSDFGRGGAAEWLGLKRTTLQNKMKRLGIEKKKDYALIDTNRLWQLPPQQPTVAAEDERPPPIVRNERFELSPLCLVASLPKS